MASRQCENITYIFVSQQVISCFNTQYRDSHYNDKWFVRHSYLYTENLSAGKAVHLH